MLLVEIEDGDNGSQLHDMNSVAFVIGVKEFWGIECSGHEGVADLVDKKSAKGIVDSDCSTDTGRRERERCVIGKDAENGLSGIRNVVAIGWKEFDVDGLDDKAILPHDRDCPEPGYSIDWAGSAHIGYGEYFDFGVNSFGDVNENHARLL